MSTLKIGMVGLDTSHCPAFTDLINKDGNPHHVSGGVVKWAYSGGSKIFSLSYNRVDKFTARLRDEYGVEILDDIASVAEKADAILLESSDGRQHLEQFEILAPFGKPVFIDKPLACSPADAEKILELSAKHGAPVFSASSLRYNAAWYKTVEGKQVAAVEAHGPAALLDDYPGYYWYGIHTAEVLYEFLGCGCKTVRVDSADKVDVITGTWEDGRFGVIIGTRLDTSSFGLTLFTSDSVLQENAASEPPGYASLQVKVMEFFKSGKSPVSASEMLEVVKFLDAANRARESGEIVSLT